MAELRVLYLWNPAGALSPVADWLIDYGQQAMIIMSTEFDLFGNTSISRAARMVHSSNQYYREVIKQLIVFQPTHIHVNASLPSLVLARLLHPTLPIIFHYHGIEVRNRQSVHPEMVLADKVLVSTPDLRKYGEWYDRPVDRIFHYTGGRENNTAIMFYADFFMKDLREQAKEWCDMRGIKLTIVEREHDKGIPFKDMPAFLSKFEFFMDFKGYGDPEAISRLAIEALACGCKVISDTNPTRVITDYPSAKPEQYYSLYKSMMRPSLSLRRFAICIRGIAKWMTGRLT
jgi:hypothetical protein